MQRPLQQDYWNSEEGLCPITSVGSRLLDERLAAIVLKSELALGRRTINWDQQSGVLIGTY